MPMTLKNRGKRKKSALHDDINHTYSHLHTQRQDTTIIIIQLLV